MDRTEQEYIGRCKQLIEEKFHFGNGHGELRQRDLEFLADSIEEKSGIKLSLSTLKRLWKKDYDKTPHPSTLQALVSVLGYNNWQAFKSQEMPAPATDPTPPVRHTPRRFKKWMVAPAIIPIAVLFWLIAFRAGPDGNRPVVKGEVIFSGSKTVSQGVPNTVIFNYDVKNVKADSFFFQQSWNELEKVKLDPKQKLYSTIYYYPGFHRAKLIANDSIIKRFRVHITTDGWFPLAKYEYDDIRPIYIKQKDAPGDSVLHLSRADLIASDVNVDKGFTVSYFNVRDFNAHSDNFTLDTRVKSDDFKTVPCPGFDLAIMTEEHIYVTSIMGKGCEREIRIKMGEVVHTGKHHDLSVFGRDLHQWQILQIKVANKQATIFLDNKPVYTMSYKKDFGKIVGLAYNFIGTGAIDYVRLTDGNDKLVYADEFN
jgi:hypothetical protein